MKRTPVCVLALLVLPFPTPAGEDTKKTELEGVWERVSIHRDEKKLGPPKGHLLTIKDNTIVLKANNRLVTAGTFALDISKGPKEIDVTYKEGPDAGKTFRAIYQLEKDRLVIRCPHTIEGERPRHFNVGQGSKGFVSEYRRSK